MEIVETAHCGGNPQSGCVVDVTFDSISIGAQIDYRVFAPQVL